MCRAHHPLTVDIGDVFLQRSPNSGSGIFCRIPYTSDLGQMFSSSISGLVRLRLHFFLQEMQDVVKYQIIAVFVFRLEEEEQI